MSENMLTNLAQARNELKRQVNEWMLTEGMAGRLRQNSHAPMWRDYEASEGALAKALHAISIPQQDSPNE